MSDAARFFQDEPGKLDPLEFSPETQALIEALSADDDDKIVAFSTIQGRPERAAKVDPVAEVADEAYEIEDEDEQTSSPADWSTVSTKRARQFIENNPDARIEILFPTVFEEDRSKKISDLDAAYTAKAISHRVMSEQVAKELGFENYDYDIAQQQIEDERSTLSPRLGAGDDLADQVGDARRGPTDPLDRDSLRDDRPPADELSDLRQDERSAS